MNEKFANERPTSKMFELRVERVDVEHGHVYIADGPTIWKWFYDTDGRAILVNGSEQSISAEKRMAMRAQVIKIMGDRLAAARRKEEER